MMVTILLILLLGPVFFSYVGYPLLMRLLAKLYAKPWKVDDSSTPTISVILAVHNEEKLIAGCLRSIFEQDYPSGKIEILVGSDGSTDSTDRLVLQEASKNDSIRPFLFNERRGKMPVLNDLVRQAKHEVLLFADADIQFDKRAFRAHTRHYVDPIVGCVSGYLRYQAKSDGAVLLGESRYMLVENNLRKNEASVSSTVGLFGGNYSLRRSEFREFPSGVIHDDLFATLQIISKGKRTVFEPKAISVEPFVRTMQDEFKRKTRNAGRGFRTIAFFPELVSPMSGLPALMIWSHRILRWVSPFLLIAVLLLCLVSHVFGASLPFLDYSIVIVALGITAGFALDMMGKSVPVISHLYWFAVMNLAFAAGTVRYFLGREPLLWTQTTRGQVAVTEQEAVQL